MSQSDKLMTFPVPACPCAGPRNDPLQTMTSSSISTSGTRGYRFGFLTLPQYSLIALSNALEPLRMANRVVGREVYQWAILTPDGIPAAASNGLTLTPTLELGSAGGFDIVFVCGGVNVRNATTPALLRILQRLAQARVALGSLCTGGYALTKAGLLNNYRAAIHWEDLSALREEFPRVILSPQLFVIDRNDPEGLMKLQDPVASVPLQLNQRSFGCIIELAVIGHRPRARSFSNASRGSVEITVLPGSRGQLFPVLTSSAPLRHCCCAGHIVVSHKFRIGL